MRYMRYKRFAVTSAHVCTVVRRFNIHVYNIVIEQCFLMFTKLTLRLVSHGAAMNLREISAINNNKTCYIIDVIYESTITGIYTSKAVYVIYESTITGIYTSKAVYVIYESTITGIYTSKALYIDRKSVV